MAVQEEVVYWDASAVLSVLFRDMHTETALRFSRQAGVPLLSTLALAEVHAVVARVERKRVASATSVKAVLVA